MVVREYLPGGILAKYIKNYRVVSSSEEGSNTVLPETLPMVTLVYKGSFRYIIHNRSNDMPALALSGLRSSVKHVFLAKDSGVFIVRFKELAFASFFKEPLNYFFERGISFNDVTHQQKNSGIEEQLQEAKNDYERISRVEAFLLSFLKEKNRDPVVEMALHQIRERNGMIKIYELARALNISLDAFEKRFRQAAGISPKRFSTIVKMSFAIQNRSADQSITDMALTLGYFDESHFIRDFKLFSGQTPFQYFRNTR